MGQAEDYAHRVTFINQNVSDKETLLILTDMQFLNSFTGREPYRGVPFLWDVGEVPEPTKQRVEVARHIRNHPPDWIVTHKEEGAHPINELLSYLGLSDMVLTEYRLVQAWGKYGIFRRMS